MIVRSRCCVLPLLVLALHIEIAAEKNAEITTPASTSVSTEVRPRTLAKNFTNMMLLIPKRNEIARSPYP